MGALKRFFHSMVLAMGVSSAATTASAQDMNQQQEEVAREPAKAVVKIVKTKIRNKNNATLEIKNQIARILKISPKAVYGFEMNWKAWDEAKPGSKVEVLARYKKM